MTSSSVCDPAGCTRRRMFCAVTGSTLSTPFTKKGASSCPPRVTTRSPGKTLPDRSSTNSPSRLPSDTACLRYCEPCFVSASSTNTKCSAPSRITAFIGSIKRSPAPGRITRACPVMPGTNLGISSDSFVRSLHALAKCVCVSSRSPNTANVSGTGCVGRAERINSAFCPTDTRARSRSSTSTRAQTRDKSTISNKCSFGSITLPTLKSA